MLIELVRLVVTLGLTAAGFLIGREVPGWFSGRTIDPDAAIVVGTVIGAGLGYVVGGLLGRGIRRGLDRAPQLVARASGPQLFAGTFGMVAGLLVGTVAGLPLVLLAPAVVGWPVASLIVVVLAAFGGRVFAARAHDLLAAAGLRSRTATRRSPSGGGYVIDTSAAIDGRVLELARAGVVGGEVWVPEFVLDELQGIADSGSKERRRRGRRGLEVLEALRDVPAVEVHAAEADLPGYEGVDAKLVALCQRSGATLVSTDSNLARAAGLRGVAVLNPQTLGEMLRPQYLAGDRLDLKIERAGTEPGQGVGYLDDGTMVVVEGAAEVVGQMVEVEVANTLRTSVGRMVFAKLEP
ncbi:MAG: TRAM domain-containing protein [Acidimicrobiia bacterium]|nr:TRAM domain-containing protein [Acidimicrobiia bacterium]